MKDLKNFYLNYFNDILCKRTTLDAKNYFYNFFGTNSDSAKEEVRLLELKNQLDDYEEKKLINDSLSNVKLINTRNYHIITEIENIQSQLFEKRINNKLIIQAVWLKNLLKYYPEQEKYILQDYGEFVLETAKFLNGTNYDKAFYHLNTLFKFGDEYKDVILFAIKSLGNTECKLIHEKKINHALNVGLEIYFIGNLKNDAVVAAILLDVLQYSTNTEKIKNNVSCISNKYNSQKILDIFVKSGLNPNISNNSWENRKKYQIDIISTPGRSSYSALCILLISKKINLIEISNYFKKLKVDYITKNSNDKNNKLNLYMQNVKKNFWYEYSSITETDAKEYYSKIFEICSRVGNISNTLLDEYENVYYDVFKEYPL